MPGLGGGFFAYRLAGGGGAREGVWQKTQQNRYSKMKGKIARIELGMPLLVRAAE